VNGGVQSSGRLLIVGAGLIGASVGLAATAAGYDVWIDDADPERARTAVAVGAGRARPADLDGLDLAIVAVPPRKVAEVIASLLRTGIASTVTHVCSVQLQPQVEVEGLSGPSSQFVGSHPVAGSERSGPHHASADLFRQRPWVVCPTEHSGAASVGSVTALALACGGVVREMPATEHDALLARLSHVPQLIASALAGSLVGLDRTDVALAGTGLRDTSRLADSDPQLWAEIVAANPVEVATALRAVTGPLIALEQALAAGDERAVAAVQELVGSGRLGRELLAGKHGQAAVRWATVSVVVPDEPGALARLLADAAAGEVNVEDIRVDHSPGQPLGIVELDVAPGSGSRLESELEARGWRATSAEPVAD
jgi:prephenate dehydrogenase